MKDITRKISIFLLLFPCFLLFGQNTPLQELVNAENSLYQKFTELYQFSDDPAKSKLNTLIINEFKQILENPLSFDYAFDSLKWTGRKYSPDRKFRLITWNIPAVNGTHTYYGFIQCRNKKDNPCQVFRLTDRSEEIINADKAVLSPDKWWGTLYYSILLNKYKGKRIYTLLGFDYNNRYSNKKIIDILTFENNITPIFGSPVFLSEEGRKHRIIFEFSPDVVMNLRYDLYLKMIVFDHLSPVEPALSGDPRFYAPDSSYDGFKFRKGTWEYQSDVDVRNR